MLSIDLPSDIEKRLKSVVQKSYRGDLPLAIVSFLKLHEKYGWKEQLLEDVSSIRKEVRKRGGIRSKEIDDAIKRYRKSIGEIDA
ncbi:MAG: hypothetical protein ONB27_11550 [candidate division KSB1 bacterium]|nr:hypothetical protein [candidate division KSB1 bacterium]